MENTVLYGLRDYVTIFVTFSLYFLTVSMARMQCPMQIYIVQTYRMQLGTRNTILRNRHPRCIGLAAWASITRFAPFNDIATGEFLLANGKTSH